MTDRTFSSSEITRKPAVVSHVGVQGLSAPNPNNLSDERIRAIGRNGGVIGMEMVKNRNSLGV